MNQTMVAFLGGTCFILIYLAHSSLAEKSVIKNVLVKAGKLRFKCVFKLTHDATVVNIKKSSAACTPPAPKNKGPFEVKVGFGKYQFTLNLKINPEKITSASVMLDESSGSSQESGSGSGSESGSGNGAGSVPGSVIEHGPWGEWSECLGCTNTSAALRSRVETEKIFCNDIEHPPIQSTWSPWTIWSPCSNMDSACFSSQNIQFGVHSRRRICKSNGERECPGESVEVKKCKCCENNLFVTCPDIADTFNAMVFQFPDEYDVSDSSAPYSGLTITKLTKDYSCKQPRLENGQIWSYGLRRPSISYFESKVFICSGYYFNGFYDFSEKIPRNSCMVLDPLTEEWTELDAQLNIPRYDPVSLSLGDTLYILGGFIPNSWSKIKEVEKYQIGHSQFDLVTWSLDDLGIPENSQPLKMCSLALKGKLVLSYVVDSGGVGSRKNMIILVDTDGEVTQVPEVTFIGPSANYTMDAPHLACTAVDSMLMVVTRYYGPWISTSNYQDYFIQTNILDPETMTWATVKVGNKMSAYNGNINNGNDLDTLDGIPVLVYNGRMLQWKDETWVRLPGLHVNGQGSLNLVPVPSDKLNQKC